MKSNKKNRVVWLGICVLVLLAIFPVSVLAVPEGINYQGYLTDARGQPLNRDVAITFRIWDAEESGTELWSESHAIVRVVVGVFNVVLGSSVPITAGILDGDSYLGITVGTDSEMVPRMKLTSVAYAIRAGYAESVAGGSVTSSALSETAVTESKIAEGAVSSVKLASASVTSDKVASGALTAAHLQDGTAITEILDDDGPGSGLNADFLDGYDATAFSLSGHNHDTAYVNATGDTMSSTSGGAVLSVTNTGLGQGVYGSASGSEGRGVVGYADNTGNVENYGGYFEAYGGSGRGVFGAAPGSEGRGVYGRADNAGDVENYGGYFEAYGGSGRGVFGTAPGSEGRGVYGRADNTGDVTNFGGYFVARGTYGLGVYSTATGALGRGVWGRADNAGDVTNYGGYFEAKGASGRGVSGLAWGTSGWGVEGSALGSSGWGVSGYAPGTSGIGVRGAASNTGDVQNYGGYFVAYGTSGRGVSGLAWGTSGTGVYGSASNTGNVTNNGGYFEASGTFGRGVYGYASGNAGRGVYGRADNTGNVTNYGGYFEASGSDGTGVYGAAPGASGQGVFGTASGTNGLGVYGFAGNLGNVTNYGGYFEAWGTTGRGVYGYGHGISGRGVEGTALGTSGIGVYGSGGSYDFYSAGGGGAEYGPFTGGHEVKLSEDFPEDIKPGMIVSVTGQTQIRGRENGTASLSSTLPTIKLSSRAADKAVFGVFVAETPLPQDHWYEAQEGERFATVNALGEGRVWVSNINGDIEVGDYITTSAFAGYGQRQDDDLLHSYTLGKATEAVDWDSVTETVLINGGEIKLYLIAVVYTSG
jgi:hypothetical protein